MLRCIIGTAVNPAEELANIRKDLEEVSLRTALFAVVILVAGILLTRLILVLVDRLLQRTRLDHSLHRFIKTLLRTALYFCLILILAAYLGVDVTSLVALLSVISLAISLSVQNVLANVAGGMMIIGTKPFRQGDYVAIDELEGTIDEIGVVYTKLHTMDNRSVLIPNSKVSSATLQNFSALGKRRLEVVVSATYSSDPETAMAALHRAVERCSPLEGEPVVVAIRDFGEYGVSYEVWLWIPASEFLARRYALRRYIWEEFRKDGVELSYPNLNVHVKS